MKLLLQDVGSACRTIFSGYRLCVEQLFQDLGSPCSTVTSGYR